MASPEKTPQMPKPVNCERFIMPAFGLSIFAAVCGVLFIVYAIYMFVKPADVTNETMAKTLESYVPEKLRGARELPKQPAMNRLHKKENVMFPDFPRYLYPPSSLAGQAFEIEKTRQPHEFFMPQNPDQQQQQQQQYPPYHPPPVPVPVPQNYPPLPQPVPQQQQQTHAQPHAQQSRQSRDRARHEKSKTDISFNEYDKEFTRI